MSVHHVSTDTITLAASDFAGTAPDAYNGWQASAPILFGFVTPLAAAISINDTWLRDIPLFLILLTAALVLSTALFVASLVCSGEVKAAVFDTSRARVALVRYNPFASSIWHVPFDKITDIKSIITYDQYGRKTLKPMLVLVSGSTVDLPLDLPRQDIEAARASLAQFRDKALPAPRRARDPYRRPTPRA